MKIIVKSLLSVLGFILMMTTPAYSEPKQKEVKQFVAAVGPDGVQRVEIVGGSYFYDPSYIIVKVNVPVELKIKKESGITPHDFVIKAPEAGINVSVTMDTEPKVIKFTPTKPGKYAFYCSKKIPFFASHREKGMEGVLDVRQ